MNKSIKRLVALCSILSGGMAFAYEFRSPLSLEEGPNHFRLKPVRNTWWFEAMKLENCDNTVCGWSFDMWSGAFHRSATRAFWDDELGCDNLPKNRNTSKTTTLSQLWFGIETSAATFAAGALFPGGEVTDPEILAQFNALGWAHITPNFSYTEQGVYWGFDARKEFGRDKKWHIGKRVSLPFKVIDIQQRCNSDFNGGNGSNMPLTESLPDVAIFRTMGLDADTNPNQFEYALRLDFLSSLVRQVQVGNNLVASKVVDYKAGTNTALDETTIMNFRVTAASAAETASVPPVYFVRRTDGSEPATPFRKRPVDVSGSLTAAGSGGTNNSVLFMTTSTDYLNGLGQNVAAQSQLWVVPRRDPTLDQLVGDAQSIGLLVKALIDANEGSLSQSVSDFFSQQVGIDLCPGGRALGLGDLNTETYIGYGSNDCYLDVVMGVLWPTGKPQDNIKRIYFTPTGHNRHFELKLGMEGGWMPCNWFGLKVDWAYHHAFERTEKRAAPFKGATIRNIGPEIDAKVKWDYFTFHADANFFHPCNSDLGCSFGYELFAKRKDQVRLGCPDLGCNGGITTDLLGTTAELDFTLLEKRTNSMTHKLRGEIFHRSSFFELFAGASHIVGGRNAMQESELHLGLAIYF